jgi:tRNA pseudouridine32 synthase/23S rRNA pseudouridine746 synthase/23S rRNA pseudouridine1911/1915/1917 synthase
VDPASALPRASGTNGTNGTNGTTLGPIEWPALRRGGVVFEDDAILVLDKPAGISVMGERHDTDVVRLAAEAGEELFPAHRIDKVTSGVVLLAKSTAVHGGLTRQFQQRTVDKEYLVITSTVGLPEHGTIDLPLTEGRKGRVRIAAQRDAIVVDEAGGTAAARWSVPRSKVAEAAKDKRTYPSMTTFARVWQGKRHTVLLVRPLTGRRHQIRVHLAWIGHPIQGDPLFENEPATRTCLHSWRLAFDASWSDDHRIRVEAEPGGDFWAVLGRHVPSGGHAGLLGLVHRAAARLDALGDEGGDEGDGDSDNAADGDGEDAGQTERGRTSPTS